MEIADGLGRASATIEITWYEELFQKIKKDSEKYPDNRLKGPRILKFCRKQNNMLLFGNWLSNPEGAERKSR
jgi:hypothetical protein